MGPESRRLTIHATLVSVAGEGILFLGESGVGKSTAALWHLANGGQLVADDIVVIERIGDRLSGSAPKMLQGILSIPELGIFDVRDVLGSQYFRASSEIGRCVQLVWQEADDHCSVAKEFCGVSLQKSYQTNDKQRVPPNLLSAIDVASLRQSESRFLQSHEMSVGPTTFR